MEIFVDDDLLNFTLDSEEGEDTTNSKGAASVPPNLAADDDGRPTQSPLFPEFEEEEVLEWLTNKDAFPPVETCIFSDNLELFSDTQSSVLDDTSFSFSSSSTNAVGARTKRRRRVNFSNFPLPWLIRKKWNFAHVKTEDGIRCLHCQTDKTPQWRAGPMGPKTLCNACGVRFKSGRLLPEYRPANSPMFCSAVHSNSHKKVVEMRRQKQGKNVLARIGYDG